MDEHEIWKRRVALQEAIAWESSIIDTMTRCPVCGELLWHTDDTGTAFREIDLHNANVDIKARYHNGKIEVISRRGLLKLTPLVCPVCEWSGRGKDAMNQRGETN